METELIKALLDYGVLSLAVIFLLYTLKVFWVKIQAQEKAIAELQEKRLTESIEMLKDYQSICNEVSTSLKTMIEIANHQGRG